jgi:hypothetical protein
MTAPLHFGLSGANRLPPKPNCLIQEIFLFIQCKLTSSKSIGASPTTLGASLNPHFHFHVLVIDGVFPPDPEGEVQFYEALRLSDANIAAAEAAVRRRVLPCLERRGWLEPDTAQQMRHGHHRGGLSVDASVRVEAWDCAGLERLRYAARPPFALNRLSWTDGKVSSLLYIPPRPSPDGAAPRCTSRPWSSSSDSPRSSPPPRQHRHRYHGVCPPPLALARAGHRQRRERFRANILSTPGFAAFLPPRAGNRSARAWVDPHSPVSTQTPGQHDPFRLAVLKPSSASHRKLLPGAFLTSCHHPTDPDILRTHTNPTCLTQQYGP